MIDIWLILEKLWALFLAAKILAHLAPFSMGQMDNLSPLEVLLKKLCNFKANFLHQLFCKSLWPVPSWALTLWENSNSLFLQKSAKYNLLVQQRPCPPFFLPSAATPAHPIFSTASSASPFLFSSPPVPAPVPILPHTAMTSSQPPAVSAYLAWNPKVKSSSLM